MNNRKLAEEIVDSILSHPDCSGKLEKDRETLVLVVDGKLGPSPKINEYYKHPSWDGYP